MDDRVPQLIGLALAGAVVLLGLRTEIGGTPGGQRLFRAILLVILVVVVVAAVLLMREERRRLAPPPAGPGESTVARLGPDLNFRGDCGIDRGSAAARTPSGVAASRFHA